jgi:hypothetical protein
LSCGSQHVDDLMKLIEGLSLNCYNWLFEAVDRIV